MKPGIYQGVKMETYLALPAVSASLLKQIITRCPKAAWHESWMNTEQEKEDPNKAVDAGTIAHGILLEGSEAGVEVIDPSDYQADKTGAIPTGWTNKAIKEARDHARAMGKIPILLDSMLEIRDMVSAARAFIESLRATEPAIWMAFQPGGGESEVTMIWEDGGTLCRIRPDRMALDRKLICDYKTGGTTAEPNTWGRTQMVRMGYYTSAAFYQRGTKALCNVTPDYVWLVQEQDRPFLCSLVGLDPHAADLGARKIEHGLALWRQCMASNLWQAYPNRVCYPEIPQWEEAAFQEQEIQAVGNEYDISKLWGKDDSAGHTT